MDVMLCGQDVVTWLGWDYQVHLPFCEWWFRSVVWVCFTPVQLRIEPENSTGSLRVRGSLLCFPLLWFSSFIFLWAGAPFPGSSDQKDGSFSPNISRVYHFRSSLPGSPPQYSTARKTFGTGDLHPCCLSSKCWFSTTFWVSLLFRSPGSCVLLFWHVLHFSQQEQVLSCVCHHAESGTCHFFL